MRPMTAGAAMSVFIEILAWIVIAVGGVPVVVTLIRLEGARPRQEPAAWPGRALR